MVLPAYYDGCYVKLKQDHSRNDYNIIGAKIESEGDKVKLDFIDAESLAWEHEDDDDFFEYTEHSASWKDTIESNKKRAIEVKKELLDKSTHEVLERIKDGTKIIQSKNDPIGHYNVMSYLEESGCQERMMQGHCGAVLKSGFFNHIEKEDYIYWELK